MTPLICFGDSITAGRPFREGRRWTALLQSALDRLAPDRFAVHNRGVGGHHTADGLARYDGDVLPHLPGVVLIEFGFNDASVVNNRHVARVPLPAFKENLREIIRLVRHSGGTPILIANHPISPTSTVLQGNGAMYIDNFAPYQPAIREIATATQTPCIDLEAALAATPACELLSEDGLHLSEAGNRHYAAAVLEGLKPLLGLA